MDTARWGIGIDLGGTKICGVAVEAESGSVSEPVYRPTERNRPAGLIIDTILTTIRQLSRDREPGAVGVGIPTTLDGDGGLVACPNLPTMGGIRLPADLEARLERPVVTDNDANCFTYGEWRSGAGRGTSVCCGVTLGTGIGMGMVIGGQLHRGGHGNAGEIWCSPLEDGRNVEHVLSGDGVTGRYRGRTRQTLVPAGIARRARDGDGDAVSVWREYGRALGVALCYAVNLLDPEIVILGGSMASARDLFEGSMNEVLEHHGYDITSVRIVAAVLGGVAGAVGAAQLALDAENGA